MFAQLDKPFDDEFDGGIPVLVLGQLVGEYAYIGAMQLVGEIYELTAVVQVVLASGGIGMMELAGGAEVDKLEAVVLHLPEGGGDGGGAVEFGAFGQVHLPEYPSHFDALVIILFGKVHDSGEGPVGASQGREREGREFSGAFDGRLRGA